MFILLFASFFFLVFFLGGLFLVGGGFSSSLVSGEVRLGELMVGARRGEGGTRGLTRGDCEMRGDGRVGVGGAGRGGVCPGMC